LTSLKRDKPIFFMARQAMPMFPGDWGSTMTMEMLSAALFIVVSSA